MVAHGVTDIGYSIRSYVGDTNCVAFRITGVAALLEGGGKRKERKEKKKKRDMEQLLRSLAEFLKQI